MVTRQEYDEAVARNDAMTSIIERHEKENRAAFLTGLQAFLSSHENAAGTEELRKAVAVAAKLKTLA